MSDNAEIYLKVCRSLSYPGFFYIERRSNKYGSELPNGKREFLSDKGEFDRRLGRADKTDPDYLGRYYESIEKVDEVINKYFDVIEKSDENESDQ